MLLMSLCTSSTGIRTILTVLGCLFGLSSMLTAILLLKHVMLIELQLCWVFFSRQHVIWDLLFFKPHLQDFMAGKLPSIPGELPTLNDWENHLTTIFPEVPYIRESLVNMLDLFPRIGPNWKLSRSLFPCRLGWRGTWRWEEQMEGLGEDYVLYLLSGYVWLSS